MEDGEDIQDVVEDLRSFFHYTNTVLNSLNCIQKKWQLNNSLI